MSFINNLKQQLSPSTDYIFRDFLIDGKNVNIIFNEVLTDTSKIDDFILRKLVKLKKAELNNLINVIPDRNIKIINDDEVISHLNKGFVILIYKKNYCIELRANLERGINDVTRELSITGPKDSFSENFNTNLGLIRRRIKDVNLKCYSLEIGRCSSTRVGILYMDNIAKKELIDKVKGTISNIDIDGIIDSSYLKGTLEGKNNFFPTVMMSERPDKAAMALLEGKVVILVDMSPYVLILPNFLVDFFHTVDDYYQKPSNITFIRIVRFISFLIAILLPGVYIAITTRNYDLVSLDTLLTLKAGRTFVPFPAYIEAIFMIIAFEILKESDLRMSATTGSAVSILGGLILGDAAVSASIVSPIMIIIIAISSISALIFNSIELVNAIRIYKILFIVLASFLGIYGVVLGLVILSYKLLNLNIYGYPYLSPFIPLVKDELSDSLIKKDTSIRKRNKILTDNVDRGGYR